MRGFLWCRITWLPFHGTQQIPFMEKNIHGRKKTFNGTQQFIFVEHNKSFSQRTNIQGTKNYYWNTAIPSYLWNRNPFHGGQIFMEQKKLFMELSSSFCGTQQICFMQETFHEAAKLLMEHNKSFLWNTAHLFVKFFKNRELNKSGLTQVHDQYQS